MPLTAGTRIGRYEVIGLVGVGGMGEVYRARDALLARDVALKLIVARFSADADRVRRFEQEARTAGQLNHPNLLSIHDVGVHDGAPYLVSELLEGESLRARLKSGVIPFHRAVSYARQIAVGLAAAHARGIVHRDLKPDNLFVTTDDRIKILDFGLVKLTQPGEANRGCSVAGDTEAGTILGTVGYMSPEQVRGEPVDVRSDMFSFGVILHEMLTKRAPFNRQTEADTIAAILKEQPAEALPAGLPAGLEQILARCLEKDRDARFQSAQDLAFGLEILSEVGGSRVRRGSQRQRKRPHALPGAALVVLAAVLAAAAIAATTPWRRSAAAPPLRLSVDLGADGSFAPLTMQYGNAFAISPDGMTIVFAARRNPDAPQQLYVRRLDETAATALPDTDNAVAPFFSPDGNWIGFETGMELKKVAVTGGAPIAVASAISSRGASWTDDGAIVFSPSQERGVRLMRVSSSGGTPVPLTTLAEDEAIQAWPQVLPGGRGVLYTSSRVTGAFNDANLVVQPLPGGAPTVIQRGGYHGVYVRSGHILYVHNGALFALPFDLNRLEAVGASARVIDKIRANAITGGAHFAVSGTGTLVYMAGPSIGGGAPLDLIDRQGHAVGLRFTAANWFNPAFSPDGRRLALEIREGPSQAGDIWLHESGKALERVTTDPAQDGKPVWTPDGERIAFASDRGQAGSPNLYWQRADSNRAPQRLTISANAQQPGSWHPSGRFLAFEELRSATLRDVMILPMEGDEESGWRPGTPTVFVAGPKMDWEPRFSPDGRWIAYASTESGRWEVYVRPFPGPGASVQVSSAGGELPVWSRTKDEIIYGLEGQLMVAPFTVQGTRFMVATPQPWPNGRYETRGRNRMFDLHPDGDRAVLALAAAKAVERPSTAQFIFNFFDELKRLAPEGR